MTQASNPPYDENFADTDDRPRRPERRRRILRFIVIISLVLFVSVWFVGRTWAHFTGGSTLRWTLIPAVLTLSFIPVTIAGRRYSHPLLPPLARLTASAVGVLSFGVFAAIACWIAAGISGSHATPDTLRLIAYSLYGGAALVAVYGLINAAWIRTTRVTVTLPHLPGAWEGRTAALVTDIHLGNIRRTRFSERIVRKLNALKPSAILISGDMFDGSIMDHILEAQPWGQLNTPMGTYFVTGNHDEYASRPSVLRALLKAGIRVIDNEKLVLQGLQVVGVHDEEAGDPNKLKAILARASLDAHRPSLLLSHQPVNLKIAEEAGISLQVSGHTHAGQFWPWSVVVSRVWGRFGYGLHRHGRLQVLTSSGVGTWGPPLRVGTRSEIVLIEFRSGKA